MVAARHVREIKGVRAYREYKLAVRKFSGHNRHGFAELAALANDDLITLLGKLAKHLYLLRPGLHFPYKPSYP